MENNIKAEKLQQYISDKYQKHLTEVFELFIYASIYTTISTQFQIFLHTYLHSYTHI